MKIDSCEADAVIRVNQDLFVFEIKSCFIAQNVKGSRDRRALEIELRKKYVADQAGHPKGVAQLAGVAKAILSQEHSDLQNVGNIYPILVVEDPVLQTIAMNSYLDEIFRNEMSLPEKVKPLTLMLVDELEEVLPHIYAGDVSWRDLLEDRFINGEVVVDPMHTSFAHFAKNRGLQQRQDSFLSPLVDQLSRIIDEQYATLRP